MVAQTVVSIGQPWSRAHASRSTDPTKSLSCSLPLVDGSKPASFTRSRPLRQVSSNDALSARSRRPSTSSLRNAVPNSKSAGALSSSGTPIAEWKAFQPLPSRPVRHRRSALWKFDFSKQTDGHLCCKSVQTAPGDGCRREEALG